MLVRVEWKKGLLQLHVYRYYERIVKMCFSSNVKEVDLVLNGSREIHPAVIVNMLVAIAIYFC